MLSKRTSETSLRDALLSRLKRAVHLCALGMLALSLGIWLSSVSTSSVYAQSLHAVLVRSDPPEQSVLVNAPTSIQLQFSEPVQLIGHPIVVLSPKGTSVAYGQVTQIRGTIVRIGVDAREQGTYLVIWQVISQDTDPTSGRFVFSVGHASGIWANTGESGVSPVGIGLQVVARWLHFLGYALGFGPFVFGLWVLLPLGLARNPIVEQRLLRLVTLGIICLVVAEPFALFAQNASLGTGLLFDPSISGDVLASSFGRVLAQRLGAALLLWVLVGVVKEGNKQGTILILVLGSVLALIDGEASHALRSTPVWLGFIATALHIIAMGVWVGGLCSLLILVPLPVVRSQLVSVVLRFGRLAAIAVLELGMTGLILAFQQLKAPGNLFATPYGNALLLKTGVLLCTLLLIVFSASFQWEKRVHWWKIEIVLLILVTGLAGVLVSLPPPLV